MRVPSGLWLSRELLVLLHSRSLLLLSLLGVLHRGRNLLLLSLRWMLRRPRAGRSINELLNLVLLQIQLPLLLLLQSFAFR